MLAAPGDYLWLAAWVLKFEKIDRAISATPRELEECDSVKN
jgi:hypothetical protein